MLLLPPSFVAPCRPSSWSTASPCSTAETLYRERSGLFKSPAFSHVAFVLLSSALHKLRNVVVTDANLAISPRARKVPPYPLLLPSDYTGATARSTMSKAVLGGGLKVVTYYDRGGIHHSATTTGCSSACLPLTLCTLHCSSLSSVDGQPRATVVQKHEAKPGPVPVRDIPLSCGRTGIFILHAEDGLCSLSTTC